MTATEPGERLTIFVGESDHHGHKPVYTELVHRARAAGLAGATVLHGTEGFGASSHLHRENPFRLSQDLPAVVVIVDRADRIEAFLPVVDELVSEGLVVRQPIEVLKLTRRRR